jgi:hypothetical protein
VDAELVDEDLPARPARHSGSEIGCSR